MSTAEGESSESQPMANRGLLGGLVGGLLGGTSSDTASVLPTLPSSVETVAAPTTGVVTTGLITTGLITTGPPATPTLSETSALVSTNSTLPALNATLLADASSAAPRSFSTSTSITVVYVRASSTPTGSLNHSGVGRRGVEVGWAVACGIGAWAVMVL